MTATSPSLATPGRDYIGVGVGALLVDESGKVLLGLRGPLAKNERGKWEIPGGKVELMETFPVALQREVLEEIGVEIEVGEMLQVCTHIIPDEQQHWVSPTYICRIVAGEPIIKEPGKCDELRWVTLAEAKELDLSLVTQQDIAVLEQKVASGEIAWPVRFAK